MRFDTMISFQAKSRPTAPAIVTMERVVTYAMLEAGIASVEARLIAAGVQRGGTAGILIANPLRQIAVILALYRQGVVSVSLPGPAEAVIPELGLTALLAEKDGVDAAPAWAIRVTDDWFDGNAEPARRPPAFGDDEPYRIALSSGTTGRPKPMWITPARTERHLPLYLGALASTGWQRIMCTLGLTTGWGYHAALTALQYGKTYVCASSPRTTLEAISLFQVDCLIASMHQARALVDAQQAIGIPTPSLRSLYIGGSAASRGFFSEMQQFCSNVISCYGSTEMGAVAMAPVGRLPDIPGAIGYVLPWLEVEAVDGDDRPLPAGTEGVLRMRTAHQAYFDGPPRSELIGRSPMVLPGRPGQRSGGWNNERHGACDRTHQRRWRQDRSRNRSSRFSGHTAPSATAQWPGSRTNAAWTRCRRPLCSGRRLAIPTSWHGVRPNSPARR